MLSATLEVLVAIETLYLSTNSCPASAATSPRFAAIGSRRSGPSDHVDQAVHKYLSDRADQAVHKHLGRRVKNCKKNPLTLQNKPGVQRDPLCTVNVLIFSRIDPYS